MDGVESSYSLLKRIAFIVTDSVNQLIDGATASQDDATIDHVAQD